MAGHWFQGQPIVPDGGRRNTGGLRYWFQGVPFFDASFVPYYMRPDADDTDGTWTNEAAGTILYTSIDEAAIDDADYIRSAEGPALDLCKLSLGNPGVTPGEPFVVSYRFKKSGTTGAMDLRVRLLEGATQRASWDETGISSDYIVRERTLSSAEFASITNFTNLFIEFRANQTA